MIVIRRCVVQKCFCALLDIMLRGHLGWIVNFIPVQRLMLMMSPRKNQLVQSLVKKEEAVKAEVGAKEVVKEEAMNRNLLLQKKKKKRVSNQALHKISTMDWEQLQDLQTHSALTGGGSPLPTHVSPVEVIAECAKEIVTRMMIA